MDERDWAVSIDWLAMWHAFGHGEEFDRKRRLIATAMGRRLLRFLADPIFQAVITFSEELADRIVPDEQWKEWDRICDCAWDAANDLESAVQHTAAVVVAKLQNDDHKIGRAIEEAPDVFGYLAAIQSGSLSPDVSVTEGRAITSQPVFIAGAKENGGQTLADVIREVCGNPFRPVSFSPSWRTNTAVAIAQQMYDSRDFSAMPILADALQDAGCDNDDILSHCRDPKQVHVRGCWVVDLVLGKT